MTLDNFYRIFCQNYQNELFQVFLFNFWVPYYSVNNICTCPSIVQERILMRLGGMRDP